MEKVLETFHNADFFVTTKLWSKWQSPGRLRDPYLAACIRNIWLLTATHDIDLIVEHIQGTHNIVANCLSRLYSHKVTNLILLENLQNNFIWEKVHIEDLKSGPIYIISGASTQSSFLLDSAWQKV